MTSFSFLWKEKNHLKMRIPDTIVVKDGKISEWFYTSKKGFVMKHKAESATIPKLIKLFENEDEKDDSVIAIQRAVDAASNFQAKALLCSHFDVLIMHMTNESLPLENQNFLIQNFIPPANNLRYITNFNKGSIEIRVEPYDQEYRINGKYSNPRKLSIPSNEINENDRKEVDSLARLVCSYIAINYGNVSECELEWIRNSGNEWALINVMRIGQDSSIPQSARTEAVNSNVRDENIAPTSIKYRRPPSAPRLHMSSEERILRSRPPSASNSRITPRQPRRVSDSLLPQPRSASSIHSTSPNTLTNRSFRFSKETKNHSTQTSDECCGCKDELERSIKEMVAAKKRNEELEEIVIKLEESHKAEIEENDKKWKEKCIEIGNAMGEKLHEERKKYEAKIKMLMKKIEGLSIE
ncbi:unnamed protein product [Blepharisma stoltei]|uniref:Uncharacterized protein n=1 Tax=Blepharisma stoltei TaxID=1481888 RepID=A0AAU9JSG6_9CILI|nr:unnamed protein product [Blepharisma stoltei]